MFENYRLQKTKPHREIPKFPIKSPHQRQEVSGAVATEQDQLHSTKRG